MGSSFSVPNPAPQPNSTQALEKGKGRGGGGGGCPMHNEDLRSPQTEDSERRNRSEKFNDLNNIPELSQDPSPGQESSLSRERTMSSIPRSRTQSFSTSSSTAAAEPKRGELRSSCPISGEESNQGTWVYPSPQQFYNALVRKGWETPAPAIPTMVEIHNWMNEAVWQEVLRWENKYFSNRTNLGTENSTTTTTTTTSSSSSSSSSSSKIEGGSEDSSIGRIIYQPEVSLARFQGRPKDLSPKARYHIMLSKIFPSIYSSQEPFDRHDWMIRRDGLGSVEEDKLHRYVIDYYAGAEDENGNPVFHFDVRPAIDDFDSLRVRLSEWARIKKENWLNNSETESESNKIR